MDTIVIALAGPIGSGKSTLSFAIAEELGLPRASFGDYVRSVARQRGLTENRETLQLVGFELMRNGWRPFCEAVLSQTGWKKGEGVVVDGIRHSGVIETLHQMTAPSKFILVFVSIAERERQIRLVQKGIRDEEERTKIESHPTEVQVKLLESKADLILDGTRPPSELVEQIMEYLNTNL
ncbi:MAG: AAA family ATPase [Dehalococcoidia bacterium]